MLGGVRLFDVRLTYLNDQLLLCHGKQPLPYVVGITVLSVRVRALNIKNFLPITLLGKKNSKI
jgi:hypothetical protein